MNVRQLLFDVFGPDDCLPARRYLIFAPGIATLLAYLKLRRVL